jgi:hypothetical protein
MDYWEWDRAFGLPLYIDTLCRYLERNSLQRGSMLSACGPNHAPEHRTLEKRARTC